MVINRVLNTFSFVVCQTCHIPSVRTTFCYVLNIVIFWLDWLNREYEIVWKTISALILNIDSHRIFGSLACYHISHSGYIPLCQSNLGYVRKSIFKIVVDDCINGTSSIRYLTDGKGRCSIWDCS